MTATPGTAVPTRSVSVAPGVGGFLAKPRGRTGDGIVVVMEAYGLNEFVSETCRRFARAGYVACAPDHYHGETFEYANRDGAMGKLMTMDDATMMAEVGGALDVLEQEGARRNAIIGFCMGGRAAFLANATFGDRLRASVSFYGGGIAPAAPKGPRKPLLDRVPDLKVPQLLVYGAQDASIPPDEQGSHRRGARGREQALHPRGVSRCARTRSRRSTATAIGSRRRRRVPRGVPVPGRGVRAQRGRAALTEAPASGRRRTIRRLRRPARAAPVRVPTPRTLTDGPHDDRPHPRHDGHRAARGAAAARNGAHWGRFVRTIVEVETDDGIVGLGEMGGGGEDAEARVPRARRRTSSATTRSRSRRCASRSANPTASPLQQPHAAPRRDRVRLPRHHRPEARRAGLRPPRRQAARRGAVRELPLLPLRRSGDRRGRGAHAPSRSSRTRATSRRSTASRPTSSRAASFRPTTSWSATARSPRRFPGDRVPLRPQRALSSSSRRSASARRSRTSTTTTSRIRSGA